MNFPTIAIIFSLFFCAAWAGICMSKPRIPQSGNITWNKARDSTSARFSEGIPACIDYCHETNTTNFTKFRDTAGSSGGGDMHKIKAPLKARETKSITNEDAMNSVWADHWADNKTKSSSKVSTQKWQTQGENSQKAEWPTHTLKRRNGARK